MVLTFAAGALAFLTVLLLWSGVRGRLVTEHPVCRECHFDLIGSGGAARCPECGADLSRKRAVRQGFRRRRGWAVGLGVLTLLMFLGTAGVLVLPLATGVNWNEYKPNWLLIQEAKGAVAPNELVLRELMARRSAGTLSAGEYRSLVDHALKRQTDQHLGWSAVWGDLIKDAADRGDIGNKQYGEFRAQSVAVLAKIATKVRLGQALRYQLDFGPACGDSSNDIGLQVEAGELVVRDEQGKDHTFPLSGGAAVSSWRGSKWGTGGSAQVQGVGAGTRQVRLALNVLIREKGSVVGRKQVELDQAVEFVEPGREMVAIRADERLRTQVERSISKIRIEVASKTSTMWAHVRVTYEVQGAPMDLGFEVTARHTGEDGRIREWRFPAFSAPASGSSHLHSIGAMMKLPDDFDVDRVTLVLRGASGPAEGLIDVDEVWGGEIVIPDVPVER